MAEPIPIFVTPSTTLVQVNTLQIPYTPVILNAYNYTGQVVTVLDATSSFGVVQSSIVVSTQTATQFSDGSISTLINQPRGFITVQAQVPNVWNFLNSFPFRNQYFSAGTQNLTTSTLYSQTTSTIQEITSSLTTEKLVVSGNLTLKAGITLNQTISSLGSVNLFSSVTAYETAFFSSGFSTLGAVQLNSSLTVDGNLTSVSSLRFLSTVNVSTSISVVGYLSTSLINLSGSLTNFRLIVQESTPTSIDSAGSLFVTNTLQVLSSLQSGRNIDSFYTTATYFSTLSSMAIANALAVRQSAIFHNYLSTQGNVVVKGNLSTGNTLVLENIYGRQDVSIGNTVLIQGFLSTTNLEAEAVVVKKNLLVEPTLTNPNSFQDITIQKSFGVGAFQTTSTTIGGTLSTSSYAYLQGSLYGEGVFFGRQEVSSIGSFSTLGDLYVYGSLSTFAPLSITSSATLVQNLTVTSTSFWNQSNISSSVIRGDLRILENLTATQTITLSSIVLPSSVVANNFQVSSLFVGYTGTASTTLISSLYASSIATGGIVNPSFTMDMSNVFQTLNLSTFLISSLEFQAKSVDYSSLQPSTFFQATSSFGVNTIASTNTFDVNTLAYTLSNMYVLKVLSANTMFGGIITGTLQGSGILLSNVNYPAQLSTGTILTSSLISKKIVTNSLQLSSITADLFVTQSTLQVGNMNIYGNAFINPNISTLYIAAPTNANSLLMLNNMSIYGNGAGTVKKQVIINSNFLPNFTTTDYTLGVGTTMRVNQISSPNFILPLDTLYSDVLVITDVLSTGILTVDSGYIGLSSGTFFIPESATVQTRSTNIVQPSLSSLTFNSTLFINRELQRVGINTQPYFTLDVKSVASASNVATHTSSLVQNQLQVRQSLSSIWVGTSPSGGSFYNFQISADGENWSNFPYSNTTIGLCNIAFNGGAVQFLQPDYVSPINTYVAVGQLGILTLDEGIVTSQTYQAAAGTRTAFTNVAYNGAYWVATCLTTGNVATDSLLWSSNGSSWSNAISGGLTGGANGVAWNGSLWVAVGKGSTPTNTIVTSTDGSNWTAINSGGFTGIKGGYGVVWTGLNWVATGDGNLTSSYLTSDDGVNWVTRTGFGFLNPKGWGVAIAWNGTRLVAVGTQGAVTQSIQYSDDYGQTWSIASGDLFDNPGDEGLCVSWNGAYWLAGGNQGVRKSYNGSTWFTPATAPNIMITGLAWSSNATPSLAVGSSTIQYLSPNIPYYDQLQFINNPLPTILNRTATPYVAYTSSILNVNSLQFDERQNVGTLPLITTTRSTFYQTGSALISGYVSTNAVFYQGGFYLDIQYV